MRIRKERVGNIFFNGEGHNSIKPHEKGWTQSFPIALRVESNDSVFRGYYKETNAISAKDVDLNKTDSEIKQEISLPWTQTLRIERVTISGKDGLYVEETGRPSKDYSYERIYYLFPKFNDAENLNLTIIMKPDMKDLLDRFVQTIVFKEDFTGAFLQLDSYVFDQPMVDTSDWRTVTIEEFGISYKMPEAWITQSCIESHSYYNRPTACRGRGIAFGPEDMLRSSDRDFHFSLGVASDSFSLDHRVMKILETEEEKVEPEDSMKPHLAGLFQYETGEFGGFLQLSRYDDVDVSWYEYQFNVDNKSLILSGSEGSLNDYDSRGTFEAILNSIQRVDVSDDPVVYDESSYTYYENSTLGLSFWYPKVWGSPTVGGADLGTSSTGTERGIFFSFRDWSPIILVETAGYHRFQPDSRWFISVQDVDLNKTDEDIVRDLSVPQTTSLDLQRTTIDGHDALIVYDHGPNALTKEPYGYVHYLVPFYNPAHNLHFSLIIDSKYNDDTIRIFLESLKFDEQIPNDGSLFLKDASILSASLHGSFAQWFDKGTKDASEILTIYGSCPAGGMDYVECMPNGFYLYDTGELLDLPISANASIELFDVQDDGTVVSDKTLRYSLSEYDDRDLPFLVEVELKDGEVVSIKERYVP